MIDKIYSILFYSSNLEKTLEFYKQLGFLAELSGGTVRVVFDNIKMAFVDGTTELSIVPEKI